MKTTAIYIVRKTCLQKRPSLPPNENLIVSSPATTVSTFFLTIMFQHLNLHNSETRGFFKIKINEKSKLAIFLFFKNAELKKKKSIIVKKSTEKLR